MRIEDEVRRSLARRAEAVQAAPRLLDEGSHRPSPRRRVGRQVALAAFALLIGVASFAFLLPALLDRDDGVEPGSSTKPPASSPGAVDPEIREIRWSVGIGRLIGAFGSVWVVGPKGLGRVDVDTGEVEHIPVAGITPPGEPHNFDDYGGRPDGSGITAGAGSIWVTAEPDFVEIDPATNRIVRRILWADGVTNIVFDRDRLLFGSMAKGNGYLDLLDPRSRQSEGRPTYTAAFPLVLGTDHWLWAGGAPYGPGLPGALTRQSRDFAVHQTVPTVTAVDSFVEAGGSLWVTGEDILYQVSLEYGGPPASPQSVFPEPVDAVVRTFPIAGPARVASDGTAMWLLEMPRAESATLSQLDPETGAVLAGPFDLERHGPAELTVVDGEPWVSFREKGVLVVIRRSVG